MEKKTATTKPAKDHVTVKGQTNGDSNPPQKGKAGVMTTASNVKSESAPKAEPAPQQRQAVKEAEGKQQDPQESASTIAKRIKEKAKPADQFEYDDADFAQKIYDLLPEGEFVLKNGNMNVIQKL